MSTWFFENSEITPKLHFDWLSKTSPRIHFIWRGTWWKRRIEPPRYAYNHILILITKGECFFKIGKSEFELKSGSFIIIPPAVLYSSKSLSTSAQCTCVHFDWLPSSTPPAHPVRCYHPEKPDLSLIQKTPSFIPFKYYVGQFDTQKNGPILPLVETIFFRWDTENSFQQALAWGTLWELFVHLLWQKNHKNTDARQIQIAHAAKELIERNSLNPCNVRESLQPLGLSYSHICRLFHKSFRITPVEYLNLCRLERAKILLHDPKLTVAEIAYAAGYRDVGYFIRKFRQQNGATPQQYRE